jgi:hypothetical protein
MPWVKLYIMQALGIHFEDFVIWCYKQVAGKPKSKRPGQENEKLEVEPKLWHRLVGYAWVLSWWTYHTDPAMLVYIMTGFAAEGPPPFSLFRPLLKQLGVLSNERRSPSPEPFCRDWAEIEGLMSDWQHYLIL